MTMETNTTTKHSSVESGYGFGSDYLAPKMSAHQEQMIKLYRSEVMGILELSTLSDDDKQRLRRVSADYAIALVSLPDAEGDDKEEAELLKRTILDYISADLPDLSNTYTMGLGRALSKDRPATIVIDGQPLTEAQLAVAYSAIEPSKEVLDRAGESAAYSPVAFDTEVEVALSSELIELTGSRSDVKPVWTDDPIFEELEPIFDKPHTLRDELRPITGKLARLGGKVISIVGLHTPAEHRRAA